jgi:precorrin-3B C17-methyltransferase
LRIVGLGPGPAAWILPEATEALASATDLFGYGPYLDRLVLRPGQRRHASDNREELARARAALDCAADGHRVAVVSGGDPGIFAMAAAVYEALDDGVPRWRDLDIAVIPGLTAMQAAAARLGAPLGHDFCAISLSDNLKPWALIARRLKAAADSDFVIALYNPASRQRPQQVVEAFALLRDAKAGETPVAFARAVGRPDETLTVTTLAEADPSLADMATLVLIGSSMTRRFVRANGQIVLYTPRTATL